MCGGCTMKQKNTRHPLPACLFLCYCGLMLYLLFVRGRTVPETGFYWQQVASNCNFVPWHTVGNYWDVLMRPQYYIAKWADVEVYRDRAWIAAVNILGNIGMFLPLGAFLPVLWPRLQSAWKTCGIGLISIVLVEICQLFTLRGRCDVDDVLLNMLGIAMGYALWRIVRYFQRKRKKHR